MLTCSRQDKAERTDRQQCQEAQACLAQNENPWRCVRDYARACVGEQLVAQPLKRWRPLQVQNSEGAFASPIEVEEREDFSLPPPVAEVQIPFSSIQAAHQLCLCRALRGVNSKARGSRTPVSEVRGL